MRKSYILIYNDSVGSRKQVKEWANTSALVITWRFDLPNCFYLISQNSSEELGNSLREKMGSGRFLITETNDNRYGWLPQESWYLMRHRKHKPKE